MARKHAKNAGRRIADVLPDAPRPDASRYLPTSIRPLFLSRLVRQAAGGTHIDPARRQAAHLVFREWARKLIAGNLHKLSETTVEGDFTGHLLAALGYQSQAAVAADDPFTLYPKWNVPGVGIADVALGTFHFDHAAALHGKPRVLVELKGAGTDLDKRQSQKGRTPVGQAWDYLNATDGAAWALVSNFEEFRLYHRAKGTNHLHRVFLADLHDPESFADL